MYFEFEKIMQRTKVVLHCKCGAQLCNETINIERIITCDANVIYINGQDDEGF